MKRNATEKGILVLAYLHRYGWFVGTLASILIWREYMSAILGGAFLFFSLWTFVGYQCKWKHIYCSFQSLSHQKMTPDQIQWSNVKKTDAYGIPLLFLILGLASLILAVMYDKG